MAIDSAVTDIKGVSGLHDSGPKTSSKTCRAVSSRSTTATISGLFWAWSTSCQGIGLAEPLKLSDHSLNSCVYSESSQSSCSVAIRLDPKFALAYYNRGRAWYFKKDHDKAPADNTEAVRLDGTLV
jgi:hypothetical protein